MNINLGILDAARAFFGEVGDSAMKFIQTAGDAIKAFIAAAGDKIGAIVAKVAESGFPFQTLPFIAVGAGSLILLVAKLNKKN